MIERIKQGKLDEQYQILLLRDGVDCRLIAMRLARFAEAHVIGEGNRQIEALTPKKSTIVLPLDISEEDHRRMTLELRSRLFSYFIWHLPAQNYTPRVAELVDRALASVEAVLAESQGQGK